MCTVRLLFVLIIFSVFNCSITISGRIIETSYGKLEGKRVNKDQVVFKNVPFAKPPLGNLRFKLPEWPVPWKDIRNATEYSNACLSKSKIEVPSNNAPMSEDCLYLNVFTNDFCLESKSCQVIIYYHGGGINLDSAVMFNDTFILERYVGKNIIFIIPAYRLGVFGLFYLGDDNLAPHNLGIHDCLLALRFIHQEISHFGGKPDDINLMGHSAGAHISMIFGFSRLIDPNRQLFKKIIVISAVPSYDMPELLIKNCYDLAERVGCYKKNVTSDSELVNCLRWKDSRELLQVQRDMEDEYLFIWNFMKGEPFMHLNDTIESFKKNAVPREMYIGTTIDEVGWERQSKENPAIAGSFMDWENPYEVAAEFDRYHDSSPLGTVYQSFTQGIHVSAATYARAMANAGGKVFLFQTNQQPNSSHVSDMQYFIGMHREDKHTSDMDIVDSFYLDLIENFTRFGNPSPNWQQLDPARMNYYAIEVDTKRGIWPKMEEDYHEEDVNLWYINLTAFDREVTRQKKAAQSALQNPLHPGPVILDSATTPTNESSSLNVSAQWWFYALIVVVALIIFYLIYVSKRTFCRGNKRSDTYGKRHVTNETTPFFE